MISETRIYCGNSGKLIDHVSHPYNVTLTCVVQEEFTVVRSRQLYFLCFGLFILSRTSDVIALLLLPSSSPLAMATTTSNDTIQEVSAISLSYAVPHSILLQDRLIQPKEMERNESETTDDSPFTSALTTPVDQDVPINIYQGIHEALARDMDGSAVDSYFNLKAVGKCADIVQVSQQLEERSVVEVEVSFMLFKTRKRFTAIH